MNIMKVDIGFDFLYLTTLYNAMLIAANRGCSMMYNNNIDRLAEMMHFDQDSFAQIRLLRRF